VMLFHNSHRKNKVIVSAFERLKTNTHNTQSEMRVAVAVDNAKARTDGRE